MFEYSISNKNIPDAGVYLSQLQAASPSIAGFLKLESSINLISNQELYSGALATLDGITPALVPMQTVVENAIGAAIAFGNQLVISFAAENVLMGITFFGKTTDVRRATADIVSALQTGSLYDAMAACRAIPVESKDSMFVTDGRLLNFINKIETYLNQPLSESL